MENKDALIIEIGKRIQKYRIQNNLTQEQLAEKTGISQKHLSRIEKGYHNPRFDMIIHIASALNISTDSLAKDVSDDDIDLFLEKLKADVKQLDKRQLLFLQETIKLLLRMNI